MQIYHICQVPWKSNIPGIGRYPSGVRDEPVCGFVEEGEGGLIGYRARSSDYMHAVSYLPHPSLTPRCMAVARVDPTLHAGTGKAFRASKKLV
jgi:hypothetical protein